MGIPLATQAKRVILTVGGEFDSSPQENFIDFLAGGYPDAPNVIVYRTFDTLASGAAIPLTAPAGNIGDLSVCTMVAGIVDGEKCAMGFDGTDIQKILEFYFPDPLQAFYWSISIAVPDGSLAPGASISEPEAWSGDSGWKPVWFLMQDGSNSNSAEADLCIPTHIGGSAFAVQGNIIITGTRYWDYPHNAINAADHWHWGGFNTFGYVQNCDLANPDTGDSTQYRVFTSEQIQGNKTTGTTVRTASFPAFDHINENFLTENSYYGLVRINSYALNSSTSPELTQAAFKDIYLAAPAADGTVGQRVALANASTLLAATKVRNKPAAIWTTEQVRVGYSVYESGIYTHALLIASDQTLIAAQEIV